jgi:hypothetical protein
MWDIRWQEAATTATPFPLRPLIPSFALRLLREGELRGLFPSNLSNGKPPEVCRSPPIDMAPTGSWVIKCDLMVWRRPG